MKAYISRWASPRYTSIGDIEGALILTGYTPTTPAPWDAMPARCNRCDAPLSYRCYEHYRPHHHWLTFAVCPNGHVEEL